MHNTQVYHRREYWYALAGENQPTDLVTYPESRYIIKSRKHTSIPGTRKGVIRMASLQSKLIRLYLNHLKRTTDWDAPIEKLRQDVEDGARFTFFPRGVTIETVQIEDIPAEWLIPDETSKQRAMLYLHGGGFATSSINTHRAMAGRIAKAGKVSGLIIDYRLAPEHPYPAALEDTVSAYQWLLDQGIESRNIVLAGDLAGCALMLSALTVLRDRKTPLPSVVVCLSPLIDMEGTGETVTTNADRDPWLTAQGKEIFRHYIGGNEPKDPLISPLYADLTGLPPLSITVGSDEIMLSDATRLADHAREVGVDVQITVWEDMWHVFPFFTPIVPEASRAIKRSGKLSRTIWERDITQIHTSE